jgi:hypothetical protein
VGSHSGWMLRATFSCRVGQTGSNQLFEDLADAWKEGDRAIGRWFAVVRFAWFGDDDAVGGFPVGREGTSVEEGIKEVGKEGGIGEVDVLKDWVGDFVISRGGVEV